MVIYVVALRIFGYRMSSYVGLVYHPGNGVVKCVNKMYLVACKNLVNITHRSNTVIVVDIEFHYLSLCYHFPIEIKFCFSMLV